MSSKTQSLFPGLFPGFVLSPPVSLTRCPNVRRAISAPISSPMAISAIPNTATPYGETGTECQAGSTQPKTQVLTAPAPTLSPGGQGEQEMLLGTVFLQH